MTGRGRDADVTEELAIKTYDEGDGSRTSRTLWLVFDEGAPPLGSEVELVTEAGGLVASSRLTMAPDCNRLVSLSPPEQNGRSRRVRQLRAGHLAQPTSAVMEVAVTSSDPLVLEAPEPLVYVYESTELTAFARSPGTADLVVTFRDQELRATVHVE